MERIRLDIEYDGTAYCGWQRQKDNVTIQQVIEEAIDKVQGGACVVEGSGRTDAGVHALNQVAHFDSVCTIPQESWKFVLNNILPSDVRIKQSTGVQDNWHARFWAKDKTYKYVFYNNRVNTAIKRNYSFFVPYRLDEEKMKFALLDLIGEHDFNAFMSRKSDKENTVRTVYSAYLKREGDELHLYIKGNGFLHNMVRTIAGTLVDIGRGQLPEDTFKRAIETGDRVILGITADAGGLFLCSVSYFDTLEEKIRAVGF
ncbi:MAG: tRNA pseudouridine(38-40) synthase TruA [Lachnospiraceae bacterium]|nr:tRNA pseudouridine(38-40) synthase TruA [Lachnospiraceae bacterium]